LQSVASVAYLVEKAKFHGLAQLSINSLGIEDLDVFGVIPVITTFEH